ncbi:MAG TPA: tetratricopeptide repeat protein [Kiritimatiellia bacterium]|nr:tetratricopeptide repeat protein [Kiritimatiellia bacterium]HMO98893.1 tetratricopeptide repeat protein [Kiritimatiellia bacterium]
MEPVCLLKAKPTVTLLPLVRGATCLFFLVAAGCGTLSPSPRAKPEPSPEREEILRSAAALTAYAMSVRAGLEGDDEDYFTLMNQAIALDPGNIPLAMELAVAYLHRGQYEAMEALIDRILTQAPDTVRAYQLRALGLRLQGRHRDARVPLESAMRLEPQEALHYLEGASIHSRVGDLPAALSLLEHGLRRVEDRKAIFQALGELYVRQAGELTKKHAALPQAPLDVMKLASEEFPDDPYLLSLLGDLLIIHQRMEEALDVFARIEALNPTDLAIRQKLAVSLLAVGDRERAIVLLEGIAAQQPLQHRLWYYLAELHEQGGEPEQAAEAYRRAIEARPDLPEGYLKSAYLFLQRNDTESAMDVLSAGASRLPEDIRIQELTAYVHLMRNEYERAVALFQQVEEGLDRQDVRPLLTNFHLNHAIARQRAGDREGAARQLRLGAGDQSDILDDFMAATLRDRGNKERLIEALAVLEEVAELVPAEHASYTLYALIAFQAEVYETAFSLLQRAEDLAIDAGEEEALTAQFYFWLGAAAERTQRYDDAEASFLIAIARQPDHADAHNYLAYMHAERGVKLDMAYDHIGVALAIEPDNAAYIDTRGWIYYQQGEFEKARIDIQRAAELLPEDPTIADHLGDIYLALGDEEQAITWWLTSHENDPGNEDVREKLRERGRLPEAPEEDTGGEIEELIDDNESPELAPN